MHGSTVRAGLLFTTAVGLTASSTVAGGGPEIPTFVDETSTRLDADPSVGSGDTSEKDYGLGDFDRDGDTDIVAARRVGFNGNNGSPLPNTLFMNDQGVLRDMTASKAPDLLTSNRSRDVVVADFNADGWLDLMIADGPANAPQLLINQGADGNVWQGFAADTDALPDGFTADAWTVAAGDLSNDDDGYPDVFVGARSGADRVLINQGATEGGWQGFTDESTRLGSNNNPTTTAVRSSAIVDMNDDGDEDIVQDVTNPVGQTRMLANNGNGQFSGSPQTFISGATYNFGLGDLNGNGSLDIFGVRNGFDQYRENLGAGANDTIQLGSLFNAPNSNGFGAICRSEDLNEDGTDDFLVADLDQEFPQDCSRRLKIFVNSGVAPFLADAYPTPQPWTPSGTSDIALLDLDDDGDLDMMIGHCVGNSVFMQEGTPADFDNNDIVDLSEFELFLECENGPGAPPEPDAPPTVQQCLNAFDFDDDGDVDRADFYRMQRLFSLP